MGRVTILLGTLFGLVAVLDQIPSRYRDSRGEGTSNPL
jgi:hypothetical protein